MMRKNKSPDKNCPFLNQECQRQRCEIFNEKLNRCDIGLLAYNAYLLSLSIKNLFENLDQK